VGELDVAAIVAGNVLKIAGGIVDETTPSIRASSDRGYCVSATICVASEERGGWSLLTCADNVEAVQSSQACSSAVANA
jgi:hypothetical protein